MLGTLYVAMSREERSTVRYVGMVLMSVILYNQGIFFVGMWVRFRAEKETVTVASDTLQNASTYFCQWNKALSRRLSASLCTFEIMHLDHPLITL
jgi:hypothetical protein